MNINPSFSKDRVSAAFWSILLILVVYMPAAWAQPTVTTTNLPAYESFATTYTEGEALGGATTLVNWPTGNGSSSSGASVRQAAALSYPGLLTEATNNSRGLRGGTGTGKNRQFAFSPGITNGTLYLSFLFNLQTPNPSAARLFAGLSRGGGTGPTTDAGVYIDTANHLLLGKNAALTSASLPVSPTTYSLASSNTYLVVVGYTFNVGNSTNDQVSLWLNPTSLGDNGSVPSPAILTTNGNDASAALSMFDYYSASSGLNTALNFYLDEVRISTNWADVTPTNSSAGNAYTVSGGGAGCPGNAFVVNLAGSDLNVSYLLYTNGVYSGLSANGNGAAIVFAAQTNTAVYTVLATNTLTTGVSWMPGSAAISVLASPSITTQPVSVLAATNSTIQFSVVSSGSGLTYRWYRNGSALSDDGHVTGSATPTLTIYPVTAADAATTANGYYVVIANSCGYQTTSTTNALTIQAANNLVWQGTPTNIWDIATTANWTNSAGAVVVFNQGDNVMLDDTFQSSSLLLASPTLSPGVITYNSSQPMSIGGGGSIAGAGGSLRSIGTGTLTISNAHSFAGGTVISNGTIAIRNYGALGTGAVNLAGAGSSTLALGVAGNATTGLPNSVSATANSTLQYDGGGAYAGVLYGPLTGTAGKTLTLNHTAGAVTDNLRLYHTNFTCELNLNLNINGSHFAPYNNVGTQVYNGVISGNGVLFTRNGGGTIILNGANTFASTLLSLGNIGLGIDSNLGSGNSPLGTGTVLIDNAGDIGLFASGGARIVENPFAYTVNNSGNVNLIFIGTNQLTLSGTIDLSASSATNNLNRTLQVDNTNSPVILSGVVYDYGQNCGINKTGKGSLYLDGANTYAGLTVISNGLLAGSGSIAGSVIVAANSAVIGGGSAAGIGTFTVNGNLTLAGGGFFRVNATSNDYISVAGDLTNSGNGAITITNLGAPLTAGQSFALFNKALAGGNALAITGAGVTWTNKLAVDGTIVVGPASSTIANYPTNIAYSVNAGVLSISWPSTHLGWILQAQTNSLSVGISTNWADIGGSGSVTSTNLPINSANSTVFYRLRHP